MLLVSCFRILLLCCFSIVVLIYVKFFFEVSRLVKNIAICRTSDNREIWASFVDGCNAPRGFSVPDLKFFFSFSYISRFSDLKFFILYLDKNLKV